MQTNADKLKIRLLVADTLLRDLYHGWMATAEQDPDGTPKRSEDTDNLYVRCRKYFEDSGVPPRATY